MNDRNDIRDRLRSYADEYAAGMENANNIEPYRIRHPLVYLFVGDSAADVLEELHASNERQLKNGNGVFYFHLYAKRTVCLERVYGMPLHMESDDRRSLRPDLWETFIQDEDGIIRLNTVIRRMVADIWKAGPIYESRDWLSMSVVTRLDDPMNIVVQEVAVLIKSILDQSFKSVFMELFGLIHETAAGEDFGYAYSLAVSFLRELACYQKAGYMFHSQLQRTADGIKLDTNHEYGPLFESVYFIGDRDDRGIVSASPEQDIQEMLSTLNLLQHRQTLDPMRGGNTYNHQHFKQNMMPDTTGIYYASVGYTKARRPDAIVALVVLRQTYRYFIELMHQDAANFSRRQAQTLLKLDEEEITRKVSSLTPDLQEVMEIMKEQIQAQPSLSDMMAMSLRQAEKALIGDPETQFKEKVTQRAEKVFAEKKLESELHKRFGQKIILDPRYGYYCAQKCTFPDGEHSIIQELKKMEEESQELLEGLQEKLEKCLDEKMTAQSFKKVIFMRKKTLTNLIEHLMMKLCEARLEILGMKLKLDLIRAYIGQLQEIHGTACYRLQQYRELDQILEDVSREAIDHMDPFLARNIDVFYTAATKRIIKDLENSRGERFFMEEGFFGNPASWLHKGLLVFLERLLQTWELIQSNYDIFQLPLEEELLLRVNGGKEDLFIELYEWLERGASPRIQLYKSFLKRHHSEQYVFGNEESKFMHYLADSIQGRTRYKLGLMQETNRSGFDQLRMETGFRAEDMTYVRNASPVYEKYVQEGFRFHKEGWQEAVNA